MLYIVKVVLEGSEITNNCYCQMYRFETSI